MSYEIEAIVDPSTPTQPAAQAPVMREERMINPYASRLPKEKEKAKVDAQPQPVIGQVDKNEEIAAEEPKPTEETVKLSPQVAALARREQRFRLQQQEMEKERASIEAEKAQLAELKAMKEKLAAKDYSALDGLVDYNDYSQYQLTKLNGTDPVQEEIKRLREEIAGLKKNSEDFTSKQFDAAVNERRTATKELIAHSSDFPRVKKLGEQGHEAVVQHILDTFEHDSVELTVAQAAKEVEEELTRRARKWSELLEDEKKAPVEDEKKPLPPLKQGLKTLTNQVTAGDSTRPRKSLQHLSDSERWAEARRRAEEKLQQTSR